MSKLVVVAGNGTDVIIRLNGRGGLEHRLVEDASGDVAFVVKGVLRPYRFEPDIPFAEKHQLLIQLEEGNYKSFKTKGNVLFVCRGLQSATVKWSAATLFHVYVTVENRVLGKLQTGEKPRTYEVVPTPRANLPEDTRFSSAFAELLYDVASRFRA